MTAAKTTGQKRVPKERTRQASTVASRSAVAKKPVEKTAVANKPAVEGASEKVGSPISPATKTKQKLVRDSFTIPKTEYATLQSLKARALSLKHAAKKSELLRAGISALSAMSDASFVAALNAVPNLKTGRPKRDA